MDKGAWAHRQHQIAAITVTTLSSNAGAETKVDQAAHVPETAAPGRPHFNTDDRRTKINENTIGASNLNRTPDQNLRRPTTPSCTRNLAQDAHIHTAYDVTLER